MLERAATRKPAIEQESVITTIVFREGWIAADSRVTWGDLIQPREVEKLWRFKDSVYGVIGEIDGLDTVRDWIAFDSPAEHRPEFGDLTLIEFTAAGPIYEHSGKDGTMEVTPLARGFFAWGSGKHIAFGALERGATAAEAVLIAARYDVSTGGTVRELQVVNGGSADE